MRVVVTGGAGFIGAHSGRALLESGHAVTALDDLSHGKREAGPQGADLLVMDVRSPQLAAELERLRPDAVLHLAAQMDVRRSVADPMHDASVNVLGTVNVLAAAPRGGTPRLLVRSSRGGRRRGGPKRGLSSSPPRAAPCTGSRTSSPRPRSPPAGRRARTGSPSCA